MHERDFKLSRVFNFSFAEGRSYNSEREREYACVHWFSYITGRNEGWCTIYWNFSNKNEFSYVYSLYDMFEAKTIKNVKIFI